MRRDIYHYVTPPYLSFHDVFEQLLLSALRYRAFDRGLIELDDHYRIVVSSRVEQTPTNNQRLYASAGGKSPCQAATSRPS